MTWQPLTDCWLDYTARIEEASKKNKELAAEVIWPEELFMGDQEKEDINRFIAGRTNEVLEYIDSNGGINPKFIAAYLFKSLLSGMIWEKQRIGN